MAPLVGQLKNLVSSHLQMHAIKGTIEDKIRRSSFIPDKSINPESRVWMLLLYCALSILVSFERESLIDICLSLALFIGLLGESLYYLIAGSIVFDLLYYLMFAYDWIFRYKLNASGIPTIGRYLIIFMSVVLTVYKGYLFCILIKEKINTSDTESERKLVSPQLHNPYLA